MKFYYLFIGFPLLLLLVACGGTKFVPQDKLLYNGAKINFVDSENKKNKKSLASQLETFTRPKKNAGFKLWIYNTFHNPDKEKGLGNWIARKLGEPPVLFEAADVEQSEALMEDYLQDNGYFGSEVMSDTSSQNQKVKVIYNVESPGQYKLREVYFPADSTPITALFNELQKKAEIKAGQAYSLSRIQAERARLTNIARENGYFEFNQDYIFLFVDTTVGNLQTDIYLRVEQPSDSTYHRRYYMDSVFVYPTYDIEAGSNNNNDTIYYQELKIIQSEKFVNPKTLERSIAQDKGELYQESRQDQTVNHLLDLGVFKFVNLDYGAEVRNDSNYLKRYIYLTPALTQNVTASVEASTETTNFLGSAVSGSYSHLNFLGGAETFNARLSAGIETQLGGGANDSIPFVNTLELSAQASLFFPRFVVPFFKIRNTRALFVPKTRISISNNFQRRTSFFTINSFQLEYAYEWQETRRKSHILTPLNINLIQLLGTSDEFQNILDNNSRLQQSFSNTAILGLNYLYTYTTQETNTLQDYLYFRGGIETSGNLTSLLAANGAAGERRFLGTTFSQYLRFDTDTRYNIINKGNSIVGRLAVGVGIPYGNSNVLPYVKQFFVGGANSIRSFRIRGVGPGSVPPDTTTRAGFFDQTGDIKLEANLEYRFDIFSIFKGAIFTDAGNIWLMRNADQDQVQPEGEFAFDTFMDQLAVGTGVGLRLDLTFLLLRLDIAFPVRKPYLPKGERWLFNDIDILNGKWRSNNLVYNIAIGYPF